MALKNQLVKKENNSNFGVYMTSDAVKNRVNQVIGSKDGVRFISSIISAVTTTPALMKCENASLLGAALQGEALKLSPSPQLGYFYLVPYENKKAGIFQAQFQIGYKGYIQLAMRTGTYKKIVVLSLKEGEVKSWDALTEEMEAELIEDENERSKRPTVGYYAMFEYINGFRKVMYWPKSKMLTHADTYSKAFNASKYDDYINNRIPESELYKYSSFWYKDFDGMAQKTMLRQLLSKWGVMSIELETALVKDGAVIDDKGNAEYIDNDGETDITITTPENTDNSEVVEDNEADHELTAEEAEIMDGFFDNKE